MFVACEAALSLPLSVLNRYRSKMMMIVIQVRQMVWDMEMVVKLMIVPIPIG